MAVVDDGNEFDPVSPVFLDDNEDCSGGGALIAAAMSPVCRVKDGVRTSPNPARREGSVVMSNSSVTLSAELTSRVIRSASARKSAIV